MILQKILYPKPECCNDWEMYFRDLPAQENPAEGIAIAAGQSLSLETYFNAFSIGKWMLYTNLDNLSCVLKVAGDAEVKLMHAIGKKNDDEMYNARTPEEKENAMIVTWEEADAEVEKTAEGFCIRLKTLYTEGIVYPVITGTGAGATFLGGGWETEAAEEALRPVDIAYCICTFKREKEVQRNVNKIVSKIIENPDHPMYGHAEVYVSDNGNTLPADTFPCDKVHLNPNKNYGGAGGFTRAMIEAKFRREGKPFTHILLMDDDIDFDEEVLLRTYRLLQMVKDKYALAYVGGAMMELEARYMQFEYGAKWKGLHLSSFNHEWDVRLRKAVSTNDELNPVNYTGWWYCCIPAETITENNLPIPMFIHYDDIEYGARNSGHGVILLNGMCVWHPYGENKQPISMNYYDERNIMIAMSGSGFIEKKSRIIDHLSRIITRDVMRYKYEAAQICFQGFEDFYKGPSYFLSLDPEANHKRVGAANYKYETPIGIDLKKMRNRRYEEFPKYVPIAEVLCHLIPSFKDLQIVSETDIGYGFLAKRVYMYDRSKQKGYMVERSMKKTMQCLGHYFKLVKMIQNDTDRVMKEWQEAKKEFTSLAFWEKYLGLEKKA